MIASKCQWANLIGNSSLYLSPQDADLPTLPGCGPSMLSKMHGGFTVNMPYQLDNGISPWSRSSSVDGSASSMLDIGTKPYCLPQSETIHGIPRFALTCMFICVNADMMVCMYACWRWYAWIATGGGAVAIYENQLGNVTSQLRNYTLDNPTEQSILNIGL